VTTHDATGRALRYARGSAGGLLHHVRGHNQPEPMKATMTHNSQIRSAQAGSGPVSGEGGLADTNFVAHDRFKPLAIRDCSLVTGQRQYSGAAAELAIAALGR